MHVHAEGTTRDGTPTPLRCVRILLQSCIARRSQIQASTTAFTCLAAASVLPSEACALFFSPSRIISALQTGAETLRLEPIRLAGALGIKLALVSAHWLDTSAMVVTGRCFRHDVATRHGLPTVQKLARLLPVAYNEARGQLGAG